jgi:hypothetical protein
MGDHLVHLLRRDQGRVELTDGQDGLERDLTWTFWSDKLLTGTAPFVITQAMTNHGVGPPVIPSSAPSSATLELRVKLDGLRASSALDAESGSDLVVRCLRYLQQQQQEDTTLMQARCLQIPHQSEEFYGGVSVADLNLHGVTFAGCHDVKRISLELNVNLCLPTNGGTESNCLPFRAEWQQQHSLTPWPGHSDLGWETSHRPDAGEQLTMLLDVAQLGLD